MGAYLSRTESEEQQVLARQAFEHIERKPLEKVICEDFLNGEQKAKDDFVDALLSHGYAIITMDESTQNVISTYMSVVKRFFKLSPQIKLKCCRDRERYEQVPRLDMALETRHKPGYVLVEKIKEYLKLASRDEKARFPRTPADLNPKFQQVYKALRDVGRMALQTLAHYQVDSLDEYGKMENYMNEKLYLEADKLTYTQSSITVAHYLPASLEEVRQTASALKEAKQNRRRLTSHRSLQASYPLPVPTEEPEKFTPSPAITGVTDVDVPETDDKMLSCRVHTDEGLLTFVVCAQAPGLQIQDRITGQFLDVETLATPGVDLICLGGRKLRVFGQHGQVFRPTVHRVVLPSDTERYALLYSMDTPNLLHAV